MKDLTSNQRMTSMEIAEVTGKSHAHIMRDIRKMEPAWEKVTQSKFGFSTYKDSTGRTLPCYSLTKTECLYIATKFNDEARAKLVLRWEELEMKERTVPMTDNEILAKAVLISTARINELESQMTLLLPKAEYCDEVLEMKESLPGDGAGEGFCI